MLNPLSNFRYTTHIHRYSPLFFLKPLNNFKPARKPRHSPPAKIPHCVFSDMQMSKLHRQCSAPAAQARSAARMVQGPGTQQQRRRAVVVRAAPKQQMLVYVPPHPLVKHWLAITRNAATPAPLFRSALAELGRVLIYEAVREFLPTVEGTVQTPVGEADVEFVDPTRPIKLVPILRAGLVLVEQAGTVLPLSETYHVGYVRDEATLQATSYLNKLPKQLAADDLVLVADPMLATGGTMMQVLDDIVARGASPANIRVVTAVAAPPALKVMADKYPGLRVYTAIIDAELNDKGYVVPGLGDAGDRAYGTV